jgi:hypothetical protein
MKYIAFILIALAVTGVDVNIAIKFIISSMSEGNALLLASEDYVLSVFFYGFPAGIIALFSLIFLPLFELRHSRIIGWWLLLSGGLPMIALFALRH